MNHGETSKDRAMRLLRRIRERTEHTHEPIFVLELAPDCQLSVAEMQAAWEYLRDHRLIHTFSIPYTARINANGIDLLDSTTMAHSGQGSIKGGAATVRGYGRVDAAEALNRAREVPKELNRLHKHLLNLTDAGSFRIFDQQPADRDFFAVEWSDVQRIDRGDACQRVQGRGQSAKVAHHTAACTQD